MNCGLCQRREAERPQACEACRLWLPGVLRDIGELYEALTEDIEVVEADGVLLLDDGTFDAPIAYEIIRLPAGSIASPANGGRVSGSREAPVPVNLDMLDLTAPARQPNPVRGPGYYPRSLWPEDQIGHQPVATILDQWVRDWTEVRGQREHLPEPTVVTLLGWLAVRLDWACDEHPAVDEFAGEMRQLRTVLRAANGDRPELPELCEGVTCSGCDLRNTLYRMPGSAYRADCTGCGKLYTNDEYRRWTGLLFEWAKDQQWEEPMIEVSLCWQSENQDLDLGKVYVDALPPPGSLLVHPTQVRPEHPVWRVDALYIHPAQKGSAVVKAAQDGRRRVQVGDYTAFVIPTDGPFRT